MCWRTQCRTLSSSVTQKHSDLFATAHKSLSPFSFYKGVGPYPASSCFQQQSSDPSHIAYKPVQTWRPPGWDPHLPQLLWQQQWQSREQLSSLCGHLSSPTHLPRLDLWVGTVVAFEFGGPKHVVNVPEGVDTNSRASPGGNKAERVREALAITWGMAARVKTLLPRVHSGNFPATCLPERTQG